MTSNETPRPKATFTVEAWGTWSADVREGVNNCVCHDKNAGAVMEDQSAK
jgi:hypothetical protein